MRTEGNFNNEVGVPLTLFRLEPTHVAAAVEMGMNHPGEMTRLAKIAEPDAAVLTVIQPEHLKGPFATVRPLPTVLLRSGDGSENSDFWSALGGQLKPGLDITVTATVDAAAVIEAGPPVAEIEIRAVPPEPPPARSAPAPAE